MGIASSAHGSPFYWAGGHDTFWNSTGGAAGTNWSSSPDFDSGTAGLPGAGDDVYFILFASGNLNTQLGQNFAINSLNFTPDAVAANPITIGGTNLLTIGGGGLTDNSPATINISSNVALGAVQTWANNTAVPLTIGGIMSGAATNSLTFNGGGAFDLTGANSFSGSVTLTSGTVSLSGAGSILNCPSITLQAGTTLNLDSSSGANSNNRIGDATTINSRGGYLNLLGNSNTSTSETIGTLSIQSGATYVNATPGSGQTATLTCGAAGSIPSFSHSAGGTVTFSTSGTIQAPNATLSNGIIGGWATIGTTANPNGPLDWATVNGSGTVVPFSSYQALSSTPGTADNSQITGGTVTLSSGTTTINSLSLAGNGLVGFTGFLTATSATTATLVIGSGGIIAYGGTGTATYQTGTYRPVSNMIFFGRSAAQDYTANPSLYGNITSSGSDLSIFTACNLQLSSVITGSNNLVKSGPGVLDLGCGNASAQTPNTYTGKTIVNEGTIIVASQGQLGNGPGNLASLVPDAITLNGGEIEAFSSLVFNANRGITVGTRGGIIAGVAGTGDQLLQPITGPGGITLWADGYLATAGATGGRNPHQQFQQRESQQLSGANHVLGHPRLERHSRHGKRDGHPSIDSVWPEQQHSVHLPSDGQPGRSKRQPAAQPLRAGGNPAPLLCEYGRL